MLGSVESPVAGQEVKGVGEDGEEDIIEEDIKLIIWHRYGGQKGMFLDWLTMIYE